MPEEPRGKGEFEYQKKKSGPKYNAVGSEEELGDMHFSTENFSVALEYYEKALQKIHAAPQPTDLLRLYRKMSACYIEKGLLHEAAAYLKSAESNCDENDAFSKGTIARLRGVMLLERGVLDKALHEAFAAYRLLRASDEHREVGLVQVLMAICHSRLGKRDEAEQCFLDALASYRRIDDLVGEAHVLNNLGLFHKDACRFQRSVHFFNRALELCEKMGLGQHRVRVTLNLGITHLKSRDFAGAASAFANARKMAHLAGNELLYVRGTLELGLVETRTGEFAASEKHLLEARVLAERRGFGREIALGDEYLGDLMAARGDLEGALENYSTALARGKKISADGDIVAEVLRRETEIFLKQHKAEEAITVGARAVEVARKCGEVHEIGYIQRTVGLAHAMLGSADESERFVADSIKTFRDSNNQYEANKTSRLFAEHLVAKGGTESIHRARKIALGALAYFEKEDEFRDLVESHLLMARIEREIKNRDECLLHLYEAQRLADDIRDRNMLRRVRRMRRSIEEEVSEGLAAGAELPEGISGIPAKQPHLMTVLDYLLGDLVAKITFRHGFVALFADGAAGSTVTIAARRDISEQSARAIAEWFLGRDEADRASGGLLTDVLRDRRTASIRDALPGSGGPIYFHPLCRDGEPFGLLFFQSGADGGLPPRIGEAPDVVASYASFIELLVQGGSVQPPSVKEGPAKRSGDFHHVITRNDRMLRVLNLAGKVAKSDVTVLLMGETGTGKGLVAKAIHALSPRRERKFVHVNCAALPESILESELFGHVKGSFTGAICDKKGLLAEADGGTVFLDEISKTSIVMQGKLLQFLDTMKVRPVGGNEMIPVNVRLIFASKCDLMTMVKDGGMLEDLYYRINDFPITIPPLRERIEDIHLLAEYYLKVFGDRMQKHVRGFAEEALALLASYEWPGNVRELEKIVKRAMIVTDEEGVITAEAIDFDEGNSRLLQQHRLSLPDRVKDLEKRVISECLIRNGWNRSLSSAELGISYPTLLKKIRDLKVTDGY